MAKGINKVILVGNLGKDPEVRYTQGGTAVTNLRLAVGERRKKGDEWVDHTEWIGVVVFGKNAENAGQYLAKGRQVYVEGRMQTRSYKDRDGNEKWSTEVVADDLIFLGGGSGNTGDAPRGAPRRGVGAEAHSQRLAAKAEQRETQSDDGFYDEDLPF